METRPRVLWIVMDSVGIGEMPDAETFGDLGSATLQNTAHAVGGLNMPNMAKLGLGNIASIMGIDADFSPQGYFGKMAERSAGKDTTTGHWEMAGLLLTKPFSFYPDGFPPEIIDPFIQATGRGVLGNKAASGTVIIEELGKEHMATGKWIVYTSADSVFQIAAHEDIIPLDELYEACRIARAQLDSHRVGRIIARPFVGEPGSFSRTYNRHDFSMPPEGPTILTVLQQHHIPTIGVGKIKDIFAGVGVDRSISTHGNQDGLEQTEKLLDEVDHGLIYVNLVDFDMTYGHRRNPEGYAKALEQFDDFLPRLQQKLRQGDLLIITADHGCDPTFGAHTDHTREYVPLIVWTPGMEHGTDLGTRTSFADQAASIAEFFGLEWSGEGTSFMGEISLEPAE